MGITQFFTSIYDYYWFIMHDLGDPRTKDYFLVDQAVAFWFLVAFYCYFVLNLGQKLMKNREPFNIKKILLVFDLFQIVVNAYLFYKVVTLMFSGQANLICFDYDEEDNEFNRDVIDTFWLYYLVKFSDFLDTVFFVLTKKFNHISFLHVYHHAAMAAGSWGGLKYYPVGHHQNIGIYNSFVHVVMYSYYLITTYYPQKKLYSFKKLVTQLQMYQFLAIFLHTSLVILRPSCTFPRHALLVLLPNNLMIFFLFYDFYRKTYNKPVKKQE